MKSLFLTLFFTASIQILPAQLVQPEFNLPDVNPSSFRNAGTSAQQTISPRHYRQQISVYYFSQEW